MDNRDHKTDAKEALIPPSAKPLTGFERKIECEPFDIQPYMTTPIASVSNANIEIAMYAVPDLWLQAWLTCSMFSLYTFCLSNLCMPWTCPCCWMDVCGCFPKPGETERCCENWRVVRLISKMVVRNKLNPNEKTTWTHGVDGTMNYTHYNLYHAMVTADQKTNLITYSDMCKVCEANTATMQVKWDGCLQDVAKFFDKPGAGQRPEVHLHVNQQVAPPPQQQPQQPPPPQQPQMGNIAPEVAQMNRDAGAGGGGAAAAAAAGNINRFCSGCGAARQADGGPFCSSCGRRF